MRTGWSISCSICCLCEASLCILPLSLSLEVSWFEEMSKTRASYTCKPVNTSRLRNKQPKKCSCELRVSFPAGALPIFTHCMKCVLPASQSSLKCAGPALLCSALLCSALKVRDTPVSWIETIARGFLLSLSMELLGFIRRDWERRKWMLVRFGSK